MKHTKGEWSVKSFSDSRVIVKHVIHSSNGDTICKVMRDDNDDSEAELANAKLIAAAPELLEALNSLISEIDDAVMPTSSNEAISKAKAAIKKATA